MNTYWIGLPYTAPINGRVTLDWDFASKQSLPDEVTLTRDSEATYLDAEGIYQVAASDVARYSHKNNRLSPLGLFIEPEAENLVTYNYGVTILTGWTTSNVSVSAATDSYFDTGSVAELTDDVTDDYHYVTFTIPNSTTSVLRSVFVKAVDFQYLYLSQEDAAPTLANTSIFNLYNGRFEQQATGQGNLFVQYIGEDWYRVGFSSFVGGATNNQLRVGFSPVATGAGSDLQYIGTGSKLLVALPQAEAVVSTYFYQMSLAPVVSTFLEGLFSVAPSSPIRTVATAVAREPDVVTVDTTELFNNASGTLMLKVEEAVGNPVFTLGDTVTSLGSGCYLLKWESGVGELYYNGVLQAGTITVDTTVLELYATYVSHIRCWNYAVVDYLAVFYSIKYGSDAFITTWSVTDSITIPTHSSGNYNCTVYWGDGTSDTISTYDAAEWTHEYRVAGTYEVMIAGTFDRIYFNNSGDKNIIFALQQWGSNEWASLESAFYGCPALEVTATDTPNLSSCTVMDNMFRNAFVANPFVTEWDVRTIVDANYAFYKSGLDKHTNNTCRNWVTTALVEADYMFAQNATFEANPSGFDMQSLETAVAMFNSAAMSTTNYDRLLLNWAAGEELVPGAYLYVMSITGTTVAGTFGAGATPYTGGGAVEDARTYLVENVGWTINDGGAV